MKVMRSVLLGGLLMLAAISAGCSDDDESIFTLDGGADGMVTISGTMNYAAWTMGIYFAAVFPQGVMPAATGEIGSAIASGSGMTVAYTVDVPENSGSVYVFGFNDDDSSGDPTVADGVGCSTLLTVGNADIANVDFTLTLAGFCAL